MRRNMSALVGLSLLTSCSGGAGGDGGVVKTTDTTPPAITLTPSSASIEGGETVAITATASDTVDGSLTATLSCNGGTLTGNLLVTTAVTADTTITCTGTATDKAGNAGSATTTIQVKTTVASVTSDTPSTLSQGQIASLTVANLPLTAESYTAKLGDRTITLVRTLASGLGYAVPIDMPPGVHRLDFQIGSKRYTYAVTVTAAPTIADPKAVVRSKLNAMIGYADDMLGRTGLLTASQRAGVVEDRAKIVTLIGQLDTMSAAQLNEWAVMFQVSLDNLGSLPTVVAAPMGAAVTAAGLMPSATPANPARCAAVTANIETNIKILKVWMVAGAVMTVASAVTGGSLVVGVGVTMSATWAHNYLTKVLNGGIEACATLSFRKVMGVFVPSGTIPFVTATAVEDVFGFQNKKPQDMTILETRTLEGEYLQIVTRAKQTLNEVGARLKTVPQESADQLNGAVIEKSVAVPSAEITLGSVSDANILGIKSGSGNTVNMTFSYVGNPPSENIPFNFTLMRGATAIPVPAQLVVALPGAEDGAIELIQGKPITSQVQVRGAESIEIVKQPTKGSVTISTSGMVSYTPNGQAFGSDEIQYRARNANGTSRTATVLVTINRQFEGSWIVTIKSVTDNQSSPNLCPNENNTVSIFVSKVSDTQYSASYEGVPLNFTMASKDDPNGLKAHVEGTFDDDPGETTEVLNVNIPNSSQLNGMSTWFYRGPGGSRCDGQTTITGSK